MEVTPTTPVMDRENIKRMGHSLIAFSRLRSLLKMSKQQLADMPKEVMIACAAHEIALVWEKLPRHLQEDIDVLKYQYCLEHYPTNDDSSPNFDVIDGPVPRKILCCYCKLRDVNIASNNEVNTTSTDTSTPTKKRKLLLHCFNQ